MFNITPRHSAKASRSYYSPTKADRDAAPGHPREYGGRGFDHLGANPLNVTARQWSRIVGNRTPDGKRKITPYDVKGGISIYDLNLNVPKSVSLAIEFAPEGRAILQAVLRTGDRFMAERVQPLAACKYPLGGGKQGTRHTDNLSWAREIHALARPEKGKPMPNWHLHYQVANHTFDPGAKSVRGGKHAQTGAFRALNLLPIKVHAAELQAAFHEMLKDELQGMGLPLRSTAHRYRGESPAYAWELAAVSDATIAKFSERRRGSIQDVKDAVLEAGGHVTSKLVSAIGFLTRGEKPKAVDRDTLWESWHARLSDAERHAFEHLTTRPKINRPPLTRHRKQLALVHAVVRMVERSPDRGVVYERG